MSETMLPPTSAVAARPVRSVRLRADTFAIVSLLILGTLGVFLAYLGPSVARIDLGTSYAQIYSDDFFNPEKNNEFDYAYTGAASEIRLPGIGRGTHTLRLRISGWRPTEPEPALLSVYNHDQLIGRFQLADQRQVAPQTYELALPNLGDDASLRFTSSTFSPGNGDNRKLGVVVDWVEVRSIGVAPPFWQLINVLLAGVLGFVLLRQFGVRQLAALVIALAVVGTLAWLLAEQRLWWTVYTARFWGLLLGLNLAAPLLCRLLPWLWRVGGVSMSQRHTRWLVGILVVAALVKIGGVLYPQIIVYDQRYHVPRTEMVLNGQFLKLLVPSDVTALSVTVGIEGGHLPYSPLWYLLVAPFGFFGVDLGIASNVLNGVIDVSRSILIAYLALRLFERPLVALWAAGVYHLFEMPYYLISWGNWPTQLGLWGGLLLICAVAATLEHANDRRTFAVLTAGAVASMATYTVLGVVTFSMIGMLAVMEVLRRTRPGLLRGRTLVAGLIAAEAVVFLVYHIWYVPTILADTLPAVVSGIANPSEQLHGAERPSPLGMTQINWDYTLNHLTWAVVALLPVGAVMAFRQAKRGRLLIAAWLLTLAAFTVFDFAVVEMIFKHIFFSLPLFALFVGLVFGALWSQPQWLVRLVPVGICLYLATFIVERWWFYIMVKRH